MKNYDESRKSSYIKYWKVNSLYDWALPQKLRVHGFKWVEDLHEFDEGFIKNCKEKCKEEYFLEVDIQYPEKLHNVQKDLPFLPERRNIEKVEKLVANLHNENKYDIHIRNLKQALNYG